MDSVTAGWNAPAVGVHDVLDRFLAAVDHRGDVADVDRLALGDADDHVPDVGGAGQELAHLQGELTVVGGEPAAGEAPVERAERAVHLHGRQAVGGEPVRVEHHPDLAALAADDGGRRHVGGLLDGIVHLGGDATQVEVAVALAPERQRQDGHVVDGARLDERLGGARRDEVEIGVHLLVELDDAVFLVLADVEADDGHGHPRAGCGVDVLDARDLPDQLLHGLGDPLLDFLGAGAGHGHEDIEHGHLDLRLLLAGEAPHGERAQRQ